MLVKYAKAVRLPLLVTLCLLGIAPAARSAAITDVVDSFGRSEADGFDFALTAGWEMLLRQGRILREFRCLAHDTVEGGGATLCPGGSTILNARELTVDRQIQLLNIGMEVGFWRNAALRARVPLVLFDQTRLDFDGSVDVNNSTVDPYNRPSLFPLPNLGATRSGLGDLSVGVRFTPLSFARDPTRATWAIDFDLTMPTARLKEARNKAVGEGLWTFRIATAISSRPLSWIEPYFQGGATLRVPAEDSLYVDWGKTQTLVAPGHRVDAAVGVEFLPYENRSLERAVVIDLGGRVVYTFEGREYTDLFDALGDSSCDPDDESACELTTYHRGNLDPDTGKRLKADGISDVEQYATLSTWLGVRYQPIPNLQLLARFTLLSELPHFLTTADAGRDLDPDEGNEVEWENSFGDNEFNPVYNEAYDSLGSRFRSGGLLTYGVTVALQGRF